MAIRFGAGKKTKHVELRYFYMQDLVRSGVLIVRKVHLCKPSQCINEVFTD